MRKIAWIFTFLLGLWGSRADAQEPRPTLQWDGGVTVGMFDSSPAEPSAAYGDDWYFEGRYAASIGRYWTDHLKTEFEFAATGEGSRYAQRFSNAPGVPPNFPYGAQEYYRLQQASGRVVWQFLENAWVHPYVFGGVTLDIERQRTQIHEQYYYSGSDPRVPANRVLITPQRDLGPQTVRRAGATVGAGTKIYVTPRTYFNTAVIGSSAKSTRTISFVGGFGMEF